MSSTDIDPDIQAAFSGAPPAASSHTNIDDDVAAAFGVSNAGDGPPAITPAGTQIGHAAMDLAGSFAHGVGTLVDVGRNVGRTFSDQPTIEYGSPESMANYFSKPFRHAPDVEPEPDVKEQIRRGFPKLGDQPSVKAALDTPLGHTLASDVVKPAADIAQAAGTAQLAAGGIRGLFPERAPLAPPALSAQEVVNKASAGQSMGAASAGIDTSKLTPETQAEIVEAGKQGLPLNDTALKRHAVAESLPVPQRLTRGMATGDTQLTSEEINSRRTNPEIGNHLDNLNQGLVDNIDELRREAAPQAVGNNRIQNDQALVDSLKDVHLQRKAAWKQEYNAAEAANGGPVQLDGSAALDAADAALKKQSRFKLLPQSVQGVLDEIRENKGGMTLDDLEGYRTTMAKAARAAERSPDGGNVSYAIGLARDALEKNVKMEPGASTVAKQHYDTARRMVATDYAEREVNPAYDAAVNDVSVTKRGERSDLAGKFGDKYVIGGTSANLQRMRTLLGNDVPAQQTMTAVALNHLRESAGINPEQTTGNFSQHGYNSAWSYDIAPRAKELLQDPQVIEHAKNIGDVAQWEQARSKSMYVNASNTAVADRPVAAAMKTGLGHLTEAGTELLPGPARATVKLGKSMLKSSQDAKALAAAEAERQQFVTETTKPGAGLTYQKR